LQCKSYITNSHYYSQFAQFFKKINSPKEFYLTLNIRHNIFHFEIKLKFWHFASAIFKIMNRRNHKPYPKTVIQKYFTNAFAILCSMRSIYGKALFKTVHIEWFFIISTPHTVNSGIRKTEEQRKSNNITLLLSIVYDRDHLSGDH
jgi:hypothetical protein